MRQRVHRGMFLLAVIFLVGTNLARAQHGVAVTFTSDITWKTLDARSSSAQVTSDDESVLKSKGYAKIGTITASIETKKADTDIAQQLEAAILQKAAEAGGDFVRFTKTAETETTGKKKTMVVSEGSVWRNDADLAKMMDLLGLAANGVAKDMQKEIGNADDLAAMVGAPAKQADSTQASPNVGTTFSSMLGKKIDSDEVKTWLSSLGAPEIDRSSGTCYYNFKSTGISLKLDAQDELDTIVLYAEGADGFQQYKGDLPLGLTFQLTRKEIEGILGPPDSSGGGAINIWTSYLSKGLVITYNTKRSDDVEARVYDISISAVP